MNDREQFEAAVCSIVPRPLFSRNEDGSYQEIMVRGFWSLWRAARATPAQPVPLSALIMKANAEYLRSFLMADEYEAFDRATVSAIEGLVTSEKSLATEDMQQWSSVQDRWRGYGAALKWAGKATEPAAPSIAKDGQKSED